MNGNGEHAEQQLLTTREVADSLGVEMKTLQLWVREENVRPISKGEGKCRRLSWTPEAIEQAARVRDRQPKASPLIAAMGPVLLAALQESKRARDYQGADDVIVASDKKGRVFRSDTTLGEVLRRMRGEYFILRR